MHRTVSLQFNEPLHTCASRECPVNINGKGKERSSRTACPDENRDTMVCLPRNEMYRGEVHPGYLSRDQLLDYTLSFKFFYFQILLPIRLFFL